MPWQIYLCVFALVLIDYATGIAGAVVNKNFSSVVMREGLYHKFAYVVVFALAFIVSYMAGFMDFGYVYGAGILSLVTIWIAITEVGSILENVCKIFPDLADSKLFSIFENAHFVEYEKEPEIDNENGQE